MIPMLIRLKYTFQAFQKDQLWLPFGIMALFIIISLFIPAANRFNFARAFLGFMLPLLSGGLSAFAFLADPALELQFTSNHRVWKMIYERLGIIFIVVSATSLVFQAITAWMDISLMPLGEFPQRQLVWFVPCFSLLILGGAASLVTKNCHTGFSLVGGLWIFQLLARGWFAHDPVFRYFLLFFGAMAPLSKERILNQITLLTISALLLVVTYVLLRKQERYI